MLGEADSTAKAMDRDWNVVDRTTKVMDRKPNLADILGI